MISINYYDNLVDLSKINKINDEQLYSYYFNENDNLLELLKGNDKNHLKNIFFNEKFNQSIEPLKKLINLRKIKFGEHFNQSIEPLKNLLQLEELEIPIISSQNNINIFTQLPKLKKIIFIHRSEYTFLNYTIPLKNIHNLKIISNNLNYN